MRDALDYEFNHFDRFGETAQGYHASLQDDFQNMDDQEIDQEYIFWSSARLYLKNLGEKTQEFPENVILDTVAAHNAYKGRGNRTRFEISSEPKDFENYFELRSLIDCENVENHLSWDGEQTYFDFICTPADTCLAVDQALKGESNFYIPKQFNNIITDYNDCEKAQTDQESIINSGQKFYTDILEHANLLDTNGDPFGARNYVEDLEELEGVTWVLGQDKNVEEAVCQLDKDDIYTVAPLLGSRILEEETYR